MSPGETNPVPTSRPFVVSPWGGGGGLCPAVRLGSKQVSPGKYLVPTKFKQPGQYICFQKVCSSMFCRSFLPACWELSLPYFS